MNRKFLVFSVLVSSLIVLVSLVYYIHTGYRLRVENENVQEMIAKLETADVDGWTTSAPLQPLTPEHTDAQPTENERFVTEREGFENLFEGMELDETEIAAYLELFDEIEASGEWGTDTTDGLLSRREREQLFTELKPLYDGRKEVMRELMPLSNEADQRWKRMQEIGELMIGTSDDNTARLHEESERHSARLDELYPILDSYHEEDKQLLKQIKQKISEYGISHREFYDRYRVTGVFDSWREAL